MDARTLPDSLMEAVTRAKRVEAAARGTHHETVARNATNALFLAATFAGWTQTELAAVWGMKRQTMSKRIGAARRRFGEGHRTGIEVEPAPLTLPRVHRRAIERTPQDQREWLTVKEAAQQTGRSVSTFRNWLAAGVLPNTDRRSQGVFYVLRADLDRVVRHARQGAYVDLKGMRARIELSTV